LASRGGARTQRRAWPAAPDLAALGLEFTEAFGVGLGEVGSLLRVLDALAEFAALAFDELDLTGGLLTLGAENRPRKQL
jgi:hypothetical protein